VSALCTGNEPRCLVAVHERRNTDVPVGPQRSTDGAALQARPRRGVRERPIDRSVRPAISAAASHVICGLSGCRAFGLGLVSPRAHRTLANDVVRLMVSFKANAKGGSAHEHKDTSGS